MGEGKEKEQEKVEGKIEGKEKDEEKENKKWGEWIEEEFCEKDIEKFLDAIGFTEGEKERYLKDGLIPPTFLTVFRKGRPPYPVKDYTTLLHAEQEYEFFHPLPKPKTKIKYRTRIADINEKVSKKTGKKMTFIVFETEYYTDERLFCIARATIVFL